MSDIVQFVPRAEHDAHANLVEFIRLARQDLTAFSNGGAWDNDVWRHNNTVVVFATKTASLGSRSFTPLAEPFKDFAKAYVRYSYSHKPVKSMVQTLQALRCIEAALLDACGRAEIALFSPAVMDACAAKCREFYSSTDVQCNTGRKIQDIFDFVRTSYLVPSLPAWKSPFKKPVNLNEDIGEVGKAHRAKKLPSNETMLAVADLFAQADDPESRFFSSIVILLMATPSRISEVLSLPINCIQWEADKQGVPQMHLRWRAAKGKGAMKKWVLPAMHDVVQEAVRRLLEIGEPARVAARFAFDNPGTFMRHPGCLSDPNLDAWNPLMPDEFCAAVGVKCPGGGWLLDGSPSWSRVVVDKGLRLLVKQGATSYSDLARYVLDSCASTHWPYLDEWRTVETWDALCLHRWNEFHKTCPIRPFSWRVPTANEVNVRLESRMELSLFDRRGLTNSDGSRIKLTTHQLRHWLSTIAERAGMDDYTLAQWAGRARVADNRHYDHRSPEERLEAAKEILQLEQPPLLAACRTYPHLSVKIAHPERRPMACADFD